MSNDAQMSMADGICAPCQAPPPDFFAVDGNLSASVLDYPNQVPPMQAETVNVATRPMLSPPTQLVGDARAAAGWQTNKKVTGMWSICADKNAWMHVDSMGWRQFASNSESAIMAFNIIAAHAKTTGKAASFYEGDDGKVTTLLVW
ncbi:MAG: hypothetical protein VKJ24_04460 [Synechococcales bacterium]|nr:hypothetical protein [Synechococcales bacterium]